MIFLALLTAPVVMLVASWAEQRRGASAGGWVAALPVSMPIAVVAVSVDSGRVTAGRLAWSAAAHVPAQVMLGVVFATVAQRRGVLRGFLAGAAAYGVGSLVVATFSAPLAAALAVPVLLVAPRILSAAPPRASRAASRRSTALLCVGASAVVALAVVGSRLAGPAVGGTLAAFPTVSSLLAIVLARRDGRGAAAGALAGLVRSLPCYLAFCVVSALALPAIGVVAVPLAIVVAVTAGRLTWATLTPPVAAEPV